MIWTNRGRFACGLSSGPWRAAGTDDPQAGAQGQDQVAAPSPPGETGWASGTGARQAGLGHREGLCSGVNSRPYPFIHALIFLKKG